MKGVILWLNPEVSVVDISHDITSHDIEEAAFTLLAAYSAFPPGTVHVVVVDPGVGSARRWILVEAGGYSFVGPDNGVFSYIFERERGARVFEVTNKDYFRSSISTTFHGRDVFAPIASAVAGGVVPEVLGVQIQNPVTLQPLKPENARNGQIRGRIIHIDRFGNCITNLTPVELTSRMMNDGAALTVNGKKITSFRRFFSEPGTVKQKLFGIWGSAGFLELAATNQSAAKILKAKRGQKVIVEIKKR